MQKSEYHFDISILPPHQFDVISALAPFTRRQKRGSVLFTSTPGQKEQIYLVIKERESSAIAGATVLDANTSAMVIQDFYILDRYRRKGAGSMLMEQIESLARERNIRKINTGKSLYADNSGMITFLNTLGFVKTPFEVHYFSQPLAAHEKRIIYIDTHDYSHFIPKNNHIVSFSNEYFNPVFEMAVEAYSNQPFNSEERIYQTLLLSSEKYSQVLVEGDQINGFAIFWATSKGIHLHFVAVQDKYQMSGVPAFLIGVGLKDAYYDGKEWFSYVAHKTDQLFKNIRQLVKDPEFIIIQMEKNISG